METKAHLNSFQKGQIEDVDKLQLAAESYLYSMNGRVIYNEDGTFAWQPAKGTSFAFTIDGNYGTSETYTPIGGIEINGKLIVFSVNSVASGGKFYSEIGLVTQAKFGVFTYQTMFNDKYDPNGQLLNFSTNFPMRDLKVVLENSKKQTVYFNDLNNEPRDFNIMLGAYPTLFNGVTYFTSPYASNPPHTYPPYYSVHGMSDMPDLTWGKIKYVKQITGGLLSGNYQYAYRYIHQSGYASPWSPLSAFVFITTDNVNSQDWTQYQMQASNVITQKGNLIEFKYLDTRFQEIEVAAVYWETEAAPTLAYSFFKGTITGSDITVQHQFGGTAIAIETLVQTYTEISKAKTGGLKDNVRQLANYEVYPLLEIDTTLITVKPIARPMASDETQMPFGDAQTLPLTNQTPVTDTVTINTFDNFPEVYQIVADYINYKGTQWANLFPGYFGGDIYPFAAVVFDRKGQAFFAQHITDLTFPQRFSNQYTDNRLSGSNTLNTGNPGDFKHTNDNYPNATQVTDNTSVNAFCLNMMGVSFSGITFPKNVIYDENGLLQISGFSIVRTNRLGQVLSQGLMTCSGASVDLSNGDEVVYNLPTFFNGYLNSDGTAYNGTAGGPNYQGQINGAAPPTNLPNSAFVAFNPVQQNTAAGGFPNYIPNGIIPTYSCSGEIGFFECPDFKINQAQLGGGPVEGDGLQVVDVCTMAYAPGNTVPNSVFTNAPTQLGVAAADLPGVSFTKIPTNTPYPYHNSYYGKLYRTAINNLITSNQDGGGYNQTVLGDLFNIENWYPDVQDGQVVQNSKTYRQNPHVVNYLGWGGLDFVAWGSLRHDIMFTSNELINRQQTVQTFGVLTDNGIGHSAYFIANYTRPIGQYQITLPLLQSRTYHNIGHFIPINATTLAAAVNNPDGSVTFNDVEVWGGDCWIDYVNYLRLYAYLQQVNADDQDYSIGWGFPVESNYNISLRQGNIVEKWGIMNSNTYYTQSQHDPFWPNSLYYLDASTNKLEDFNMNLSLEAQDTTDIYVAKPANFLPVYDFPVNEICTGVKVYGELFDTFRLFPVNNIQSADGSKGQINSMQYIFDNLWIIQDTGVARVRFNDRETQGSPLGSGIVLGTSDGFTGHDYIDEIFGTQHQFSVVNTGTALHYVDADNGKMFTFTGGKPVPTSDKFGEHTFFTNFSKNYWGQDNPIGGVGILGTADFKNHSVYFTFSNIPAGLTTPAIPGKTIEFNEASSQFKGYMPFVPNIYFNFKQNFFSPDPASGNTKIYSHDTGNFGLIYTNYVNSKLRFVANPDTTVAKWFDNQLIAMNNQQATLKMLSFTGIVNDMAPQTLVFQGDTTWEYEHGLMKYATISQDVEERLTGLSMITELEVINDADNTVVRISSVETRYRPYPKI